MHTCPQQRSGHNRAHGQQYLAREAAQHLLFQMSLYGFGQCIVSGNQKGAFAHNRKPKQYNQDCCRNQSDSAVCNAAARHRWRALWRSRIMCCAPLTTIVRANSARMHKCRGRSAASEACKCIERNRKLACQERHRRRCAFESRSKAGHCVAACLPRRDSVILRLPARVYQIPDVHAAAAQQCA